MIYISLRREAFKIFIYLFLLSFLMWRIFVLLLLVLAAIAYAQVADCTDTDSGYDQEALGKRGDVKYGITTQTDICLTSENGVSVNKSRWVKEYYCAGSPLKRESKVVDCTREGFSGCENGACVSALSSTGANAAVVPRSAEPVVVCGNKKLEKDKGEECDPPGSICFGKTSKQYGQCESNCKCRIAQSAEKAASECGDGVKDFSEDCEDDKECPANHVCSSCKCVKELTPEEIAAMGGSAEIADEVLSDDKQEQNVTTQKIDFTPKNFSENPAIKATSGITNFFKKIFGWLGTIFS